MMFGLVSKSTLIAVLNELETANLDIKNLQSELAEKNKILANQDIKFRSKAQELFYQADTESEEARVLKIQAESELFEAIRLKETNLELTAKSQELYVEVDEKYEDAKKLKEQSEKELFKTVQLKEQSEEFRAKSQELYVEADRKYEDAKKLKEQSESELLKAEQCKSNVGDENNSQNAARNILMDKKLEYYNKAKNYFKEADIVLQKAKLIKLDAEQELQHAKSCKGAYNCNFRNELDEYSQIRRESQKLLKSAENEYYEANKLKLAADNYKLVEIKKLNEEKIKLTSEINTIKNQLQSSQEEFENYEFITSITPFTQIFHEYPSEKIKNLLEINKVKQKDLINNLEAYTITDEIRWNNSLAKGKAQQKRLAKFLFKSFNAEVDNLISKSKSTNFSIMVQKIESWFDRVNKAGADNFIRIEREFLDLRIQEHRYIFEFLLNKEMELEEQRYLKEAIKEEEKVRKEIKVFVLDREKEVSNYQQDINNTLAKIKLANQTELVKLNQQIDNLNKKLELALAEKERALSMAQLTRSGYVYIISNKGSFGEGIYKIGMTRRLEPLDRVKELSNASVPFSFDVHALIPSDDAPTLEKKLHNKFSNKRVNRINKRREYFNTTIDDIEEALNEFVDEDIHLIKDIRALQYEESILLGKMEDLNE
jgi:hypothetical protein